VCLWAAFLRPAAPEQSLLAESGVRLLLAGVAFWIASWLTRAFPVLVTLVAALLVFGVCALQVLGRGQVDASRTIALSAAMLALWCALQHRRTVSG
jgi:hypothetical protein